MKNQASKKTKLDFRLLILLLMFCIANDTIQADETTRSLPEEAERSIGVDGIFTPKKILLIREWFHKKVLEIVVSENNIQEKIAQSKYLKTLVVAAKQVIAGEMSVFKFFENDSNVNVEKLVVLQVELVLLAIWTGDQFAVDKASTDLCRVYARCKTSEQKVALAGSLSDIAANLNQNFFFDQADKAYSLAAKITSKEFGASSLEAFTYRQDLIEFCEDRGKYRRALHLLTESIKMMQQQDSISADLHACLLLYKANLFNENDDLKRAEDAGREALTYLVEAAGQESRPVAVALNLIACFCYDQGKWGEAEKLNSKAIEIARKENDPELMCEFLRAVIATYWIQGKTKKAQDAIHLSQALLKDSGGWEPDFVFETKYFLNLCESTIAAKGKDYRTAASICRKNLQLVTKHRSKFSKFYVNTLKKLGIILFKADLAKEAQSTLVEALRIHAKVSEPDDYKEAECNILLAEVYGSQGNSVATAKNLDQGLRIVKKNCVRLMTGLKSEDQLRVLRINLTSVFDTAMSLILNFKNERICQESAFEWLVNCKGVTYQSSLQRPVQKNFLVESGDNSAQEQAGWISGEFVRENIPKDTLLIDIACIKKDESNFSNNQDEVKKKSYYIAVVTDNRNESNPHIINLGNSVLIDKLVHAWLVEMQEQIVSGTQSSSPVSRKKEWTQASTGAKLAEIILYPILDSVNTRTIASDFKKIIFCPDGELWMMPWAALPLPDHQFLIEKYGIRVIPSSRSLVDVRNYAKASSPVVVGDPLFDLSAKEIAQTKNEMRKNILSRTKERSSVKSLRSQEHLGRVQRLPGTLIESRTVAASMQNFTGTRARIFLQSQATEDNIKKLSNPQIIHFATHAFVLPDQEAVKPRKIFGEDFIAQGQVLQGLTSTDGKPLEDPLLRCGLLLTGCNSFNKDSNLNGSDGCLNGREISELDLRGTELVVLSACETSLGRIQQGEGIAGLRKAFISAGTKSVVSTLWKVDDQSAVDFMTRFYKHLSSEKHASDSLRAASIEIINLQKRRSIYLQPAVWSGYQCTGY